MVMSKMHDMDYLLSHLMESSEVIESSQNKVKATVSYLTEFTQDQGTEKTICRWVNLLPEFRHSLRNDKYLVTGRGLYFFESWGILHD